MLLMTIAGLTPQMAIATTATGQFADTQTATTSHNCIVNQHVPPGPFELTKLRESGAGCIDVS